MAAAPLKIGLIGAGNIARTHAKAYRQFPDLATITAICDVDADRARALADEVGAAAWSADLDAFLSRDDIDAVSVCTPTNHHSATTVAALQAGKHVLCEKPMAATAAQAMAMNDAAAGSGRMLMIAMKWRWRPEVIACRQAVESGLLGQVYFARVTGWQHRGIPARPSFIRKELAGGGGMMDNGIYNLDTILHILGHPRPLTVSAQVGAYIGPLGGPTWSAEDFTVEDFGAVFCRLEGGIGLMFCHSWAVNFQEDWLIQGTGTEGGFEFDLVCGKPLRLLAGDYANVKDVTPNPLPAGNAALGDFAHEIREFLTAILEGRPSPVPGDPFHYSNLIFDAAFQSAAEGREVVVDGPHREV